MWFLGSKADKQRLQGHKAVVIHGHRFVIRRINPLLDFREDNMPQIFTAYTARRKAPVEAVPTSERVLKRVQDDIKSMISAGLVEPKLVATGQGDQKGHEAGITVEDIMRDDDTSSKLYWEIIVHSLNKFRGLKGVFFSLRLRYARWTASQSVTENYLTKSSLIQEASV